MIAYAFVAVCRVWEGRHRPVPEGSIVMSCDANAHLLHALFPSRSSGEYVLAWSVFSRSHQAHALRCHYRRQTAGESRQNESTTGVSGLQR
nr:hypothetical protein [Nocardiopsis gilva]